MDADTDHRSLHRDKFRRAAFITHCSTNPDLYTHLNPHPHSDFYIDSHSNRDADPQSA